MKGSYHAHFGEADFVEEADALCLLELEMRPTRLFLRPLPSGGFTLSVSPVRRGFSADSPLREETADLTLTFEKIEDVVRLSDRLKELVALSTKKGKVTDAQGK